MLSELRLSGRDDATTISSSNSSFAGPRLLGIENRLKKSVILRFVVPSLALGAITPLRCRMRNEDSYLQLLEHASTRLPEGGSSRAPEIQTSSTIHVRCINIEELVCEV